MGTRSTLQFNSKKNDLSVVIYRHWDGYPSSNLSDLLAALSNTNDQETVIDKFLKNYTGEPRKGYEKYHKIYDLSNSMDYCGPYQSHLYDTGQWDLEWCYVVDLDNKNIEVYGGGYGSQDALSSGGPTNPYKEVDCYVEDAQSHYREKIAKVLTALTDLGWTVNANINTNHEAA